MRREFQRKKKHLVDINTTMMTDMDKKIVAAALYAVKKHVSILNNDDVIKSMNDRGVLEGCRAKVFHTG